MRTQVKAKSRLALALALLMATSTSAQATGIPVFDVSTMIQSLLNQINTYSQRYQDVAEYSQNAMRWMETLNHYRQELVKIQGIVMSFGVPKGQAIKEVAPDYLVAEKCYRGQRFNLQRLTSAISPNPEGNLLEQQRQFCAEIQRTRNAKFNYTVKFFEDYLPKMQDQLKQIGAQRNSSNDSGNVLGANSNLMQTSNASEVNFQEFQSQINAYDYYISALENSQKELARMALKGKGSPLGTLVKTTVLKGALEVGN